MISEFLERCGGSAVIDGGLATELECHGAELSYPLWSALCLITAPDLIRRVHLDYLEAGADVLITASYQATIQGFRSRGLSDSKSEELLRRSVDLAREAREIYLRRTNRPILIAASIGSYGAYLDDGSEYVGVYSEEMTLEALKSFHRRRFQVLAESGADLIAFETIPNKLEAQVYAELLEESEISIPAWFSFISKDGVNLVSGDLLEDCASIAEACDKVVAVGVNCTPPRFVHDLILSLRKATTKPILIYPNTGEIYDPINRVWVASAGAPESDEDFISYVAKWHEAGASLIGGCCRTTPNTVRAIRRALCKE